MIQVKDGDGEQAGVRKRRPPPPRFKSIDYHCRVHAETFECHIQRKTRSEVLNFRFDDNMMCDIKARELMVHQGERVRFDITHERRSVKPSRYDGWLRSVTVTLKRQGVPVLVCLIDLP